MFWIMIETQNKDLQLLRDFQKITGKLYIKAHALLQKNKPFFNIQSNFQVIHTMYKTIKTHFF